MKLVTARERIRGVAERWKKQYLIRSDSPTGRWAQVSSGSAGTVYDRLAALDVEKATVKDVEAIIGNDTWVTRLCDDCGKTAETTVEFGGYFGDESMELCLPCVNKAVSMVVAASAVRAKYEVGDPVWFRDDRMDVWIVLAMGVNPDTLLIGNIHGHEKLVGTGEVEPYRRP